MAERDWIRQYFAPLATRPGASGLTDDTALMSASSAPVVITTDAMVEGVHFLASDPIAGIARKLVRVNVSDILSSGAEPFEALLTLGWPPDRPESELAAFAAALGAELEAWGAGLIGGDTVSSPAGLFLSLTLTGRCLADHPVRRSGAKAGDDIWVTSEIGAARRGFLARAAGLESPWIDALHAPALPPMAVARLVADCASAAMDISDGLLGDIQSLAEASGCGAQVDLGSVPFAGGAAGQAESLDLATWGDDYQLLLTAPPESRERILRYAAGQDIRISRIGRIRSEPGLAVSDKDGRVNLPETVAFEHGRIGMSVTRP
ncbi:MAG: thiamine-phosphate kinase [Hyphomonas sp.]|uniref:thiamine-phosphate kinase n=1 Tax=Hyphomonas sp. TaxID=87 RepID=UPI0017B1934D|nr:thiamine-phosphate kinase [Hyphomonas sp.]MBU3922167.1 thiamine-phosphate kinase [Alphaproteobacteria bacterium]MBA3069991.1 thiamine-phosphate kinase [Hyphomonas sp.]MBU4060433.1 thiamine-phosphate kinase [Alphaproteobacteria bacterium]MBU4163101.1 thiamine-phosphate kinase [Alphaproteobacteria bacterium]MBU4568933.1 thiamine-phosphate kinase [Alphaproteobacteria bacterium]